MGRSPARSRTSPTRTSDRSVSPRHPDERFFCNLRGLRVRALVDPTFADRPNPPRSSRASIFVVLPPAQSSTRLRIPRELIEPLAG